MGPAYDAFVVRLRKIVMVALVNAVGVAISFGLAEGLARLSGLEARGAVRGDRGLWRYEALRGWGLIPGALGEDNRGGPDRGAVRVNAQGFRGPDFARSKGPGTRRILLLGDSFGFGVGVDEPHTVTAR